MKKHILVLTLLFLVTACSHSVHLVNMSDHSVLRDQNKGVKIEVETKQHVVLWFALDTNYVNKARTMLMRKCSRGSIQNITTRYSTSHGFFNWYNKIHMQGYCFENSITL